MKFIYRRLKFPRNGISKENQFKKELCDLIKTGSSSGDELMTINTNIFSNESYDESFDGRPTEVLSANIQLLKAIEETG